MTAEKRDNYREKFNVIKKALDQDPAINHNITIREAVDAALWTIFGVAADINRIADAVEDIALNTRGKP